MNWVSKHIDLGFVKENTKVRFNYKSNIPLEIAKISPNCATCTIVSLYNKDENKLPVAFKSGSMPKHLQVNEHKVTKTILIRYKDGKEEVLSFSAKIIK